MGHEQSDPTSPPFVFVLVLILTVRPNRSLFSGCRTGHAPVGWMFRAWERPRERTDGWILGLKGLTEKKARNGD